MNNGKYRNTEWQSQRKNKDHGKVKQGDLFGKVSRPYVMPEDRSIDINQLVDFNLAEFYLKNK